MTGELEQSGKNILLTGASGMIGSALSDALQDSGYRVYALKRNKSDVPFYYLQDSDYMHLDQTIPLHGVINLAGQNISDKRWSQKTKQQIVDSRVKLTRALSEAVAQLPHKPRAFLSASAIGYYGTDPEKTFDESSPAGSDFLAELSVNWEEATKPAQAIGIRTVFMRFGLVLSPSGGVIKNLILPMRLAAVGAIGSGNQMMSWIGLQDALKIICHLLENENFSGALNLVSEQPVSNRDFSRALAHAIGRFNLPGIPSPIVRIMFGEMADAALLPSASIKSNRMNELDLQLELTDLTTALQQMFQKQQ